jgi:hypothetical protein
MTGGDGMTGSRFDFLCQKSSIFIFALHFCRNRDRSGKHGSGRASR